MTPASLLSYYQTHRIDPVVTDLSGQSGWRRHVAARRNLYERHLGLPLAWLRDRRVIEFGPNTGTNALVLGRAEPVRLFPADVV